MGRKTLQSDQGGAVAFDEFLEQLLLTRLHARILLRGEESPSEK